MCGNGGRCISAFAYEIGISKGELNFVAIDGEHLAKVEKTDNKISSVNLKMTDVDSFCIKGNDFFVDSGSPHHIKFVNDIQSYDVFKKGEAIRHSEDYEKIIIIDDVLSPHFILEDWINYHEEHCQLQGLFWLDNIKKGNK